MRGKKLSTLTVAMAVFAATLFVTGTRAFAQGGEHKVLHSFSRNGKDGVQPRAGLIFDASGNLYGTTYQGGTGLCSSTTATGCGTVFRFSPKGGGGWTYKIVHNFQNDGRDGRSPYASLIVDASGNLYATTYQGGTGLCTLSGTVIGCGTVFELSPKTGGGWTEKILHSFSYGTDGNYPYASVIFDASGNLYGTTYAGGANGYGTVFELVPNANGLWGEKVLHSFANNGTDGYYPFASLIFDAAGNLYGTTSDGGDSANCRGTGCGTVFELVPTTGGRWGEKVLYSFEGGFGDGSYPSASLIFDTVGNLYGRPRREAAARHANVALSSSCRPGRAGDGPRPYYTALAF
jgi:uncharacterized repeat protein (TIGR03803 family)